MFSLGAAVPLGACEQQTGRTDTAHTWRVGLLLTGLTEAAVVSQRQVIVERLERHGFVESPADPMTLMITVADAKRALGSG